MSSNESLKRKQSNSTLQHSTTLRAIKRVKVSLARTILSKSSEKALNKNGELDVLAFVKAREYEIKALDTSMSASRRVLTTRAFQQVPRELRRRTASHNVKKVPKRLRDRASKEVRKLGPRMEESHKFRSLTKWCKDLDEGPQYSSSSCSKSKPHCSQTPSSS